MTNQTAVNEATKLVLNKYYGIMTKVELQHVIRTIRRVFGGRHDDVIRECHRVLKKD